MRNDPSPFFDTLLVHDSFVRRLARSLAHDDHDSMDIEQETWVAALRRGSSGAIDVPRAWLRTLVRHVASNARRGERRRLLRESRFESAEGASTPEEIAERESLRRRVVDAVLLLDEPYRRAVIARYLDEIPTNVIAQREGVSIETVRTRLKRAHEKLRARLESEFGGERGFRGVMTTLGGNAARDGAMIVFASAGAKFVAAAVVIVALVAGGTLWAPKFDDSSAIPGEVAATAGDEPEDRDDAADVDPTSVAVSDPTMVSTRESARDEKGSASLTTWRGRVVDRKGAPIEGAEIRLVEPGERIRGVAPERTIASVFTDAEGRFELVGSTRNGEGFERRYRYPRVLAKGYATTRLERFGLESRAVEDIVLVEATTLRGRVIDQHGAPVADSSVIVEKPSGIMHDWRNDGPHEYYVLDATRSDHDGRFVLTGVPTDWVNVYADADQGLFFRNESVPVMGDDSVDALELRVQRLGDENQLIVEVRDAEGRSMANATIRQLVTRTLEQGNRFTSGRDVRSDSSGRFVGYALGEEEHRFELLDRGVAIAWTETVSVGAKPVTLVAPPRVESRVIVSDVDQLRRLAVQVTLHFNARFHEERQIVERVGDEWPFTAPMGSFRLTVKSAGFLTEELGPFESTAVPPRIEVSLRRAGGVRGVVRDEKGPVAGAWVTFERSTSGNAKLDGLVVLYQPMVWGDEPRGAPQAPVHDSAFTDESGRFEIYPSFTGEALLRVDAEGHVTHTTGPIVVDPHGPDVLQDVDLVAGGAIEGRVELGEGASPAGLLVIASRGHNEIYEATVDGEGRYRLDDLPLGDYEVAVREVRDTDLSSSHGESHVRDVRATVVSGSVACCDLEFENRSKYRIEGRVTFSGASRADHWAGIVDREAPIDFTADLIRIGRDLVHNSFRLDEGRGDIDARGEFSCRSRHRESPRLVVRARSISNYYPGYYDFGIRLEEPVTTFVLDVPVGKIEVRIPPTWKSLPNHAIALWRGEPDGLALIGAQSRENHVVRFVDVPAGRVRVQIGKFDREVVVREGETTIVDAE